MTNKEITSRFRQVSIMNDDFAQYDQIRQAWIQLHKVDITMAKMIKVAMEAYKRELEG